MIKTIVYDSSKETTLTETTFTCLTQISMTKTTLILMKNVSYFLMIKWFGGTELRFNFFKNCLIKDFLQSYFIILVY